MWAKEKKEGGRPLHGFRGGRGSSDTASGHLERRGTSRRVNGRINKKREEGSITLSLKKEGGGGELLEGRVEGGAAD